MKPNKTFKDIIMNSNWSEIENEFVSIYPEEIEYLSYYKKLYWELFNLEPFDNYLNIVFDLDLSIDEEDDEYFENEFPMDFNTSDKSNVDYLKTILGYFIPPTSVKSTSETTVIVHILMEITYGYIQQFDD